MFNVHSLLRNTLLLSPDINKSIIYYWDGPFHYLICVLQLVGFDVQYVNMISVVLKRRLATDGKTDILRITSRYKVGLNLDQKFVSIIMQ